MLRQTTILDMFGRSPIAPLQDHMEKANTCVELLIPFFDAINHKNWLIVEQNQEAINKLEHEADKEKRDIRKHLSKNLLLPVPRNDLLELLASQENLANIAKDIAGIMLGRQMIIPAKLSILFSNFVKNSVEAAQQAKSAIDELDQLQEAAFQGKEIAHIELLIDKLNDIEFETDKKQIQLRQALFGIENTLSPIDVMFLYKIIEMIGFIADHAQHIGTRLQILMAN